MLRVKSIIKSFLILAISTVTAACIGDLCQKKTKGFCLQKIFSKRKQQAYSKDITENNSEVSSILNQPFYFLKKGQQCFVFISQDEKYVLKFLRWDKLEPSYFESTQKCEEKKRKLDYDFTSYRIAEDELKEETGLIYLQLQANSSLEQKIEIYDPLGIRHYVPACSTSFILQKKVDDFYSFFQKKLAENDVNEIESFLSSLAALLKNRALKGISDSDISLEYNMGIVNGKPILFDIGNLTRKSRTLSLQESIEQESRLVLSCLETLSPPLAIFLKHEIKRVSNEAL